MAQIGDTIPNAGGTGTEQDPWTPTTFEALITALVVSNAYVCLNTDIDVSKDTVYREQYSDRLRAQCACFYGTARTYSSSRAYAADDLCTWNDGTNGLQVYKCIQACTGVDVSDTDYWEVQTGVNPVHKITGLIVNAYRFLEASAEIDNIYFESCVWLCTASVSPFYGLGYNNVFNDCSFSMFFNLFTFGGILAEATFNRCSLYIRCADTTNGYNRAVGGTFNNCTLDIVNYPFSGRDPMNIFIGGMNNCSLHMTLNAKDTSSNYRYITTSVNNCFLSIKVLNQTQISRIMYLYDCRGVNILDAQDIGYISDIQTRFGTGAIQGTTAQCKDKEWLINQGFFTT